MFTGKLSVSYFKNCETSKMGQPVRDCSTKPVNLSSIPRVHMEEKNQRPRSCYKEVKAKQTKDHWIARKQMPQFTRGLQI